MRLIFRDCWKIERGPKVLLVIILLAMQAGACFCATPQKSFESAYVLEVKGKYAEAIAGYDAVLKAVAFRERWPEAAFRRIHCQSSLNRFKDAADSYERYAVAFATSEHAPEALWRAVTLRSGPLEDPKSAIRVAKELFRVFPRSEYGERASYAVSVLYFWNEELSKSKEAVHRYLTEYPSGKYAEAAKELLQELGGSL